MAVPLYFEANWQAGTLWVVISIPGVLLCCLLGCLDIDVTAQWGGVVLNPESDPLARVWNPAHEGRQSWD